MVDKIIEDLTKKIQYLIRTYKLKNSRGTACMYAPMSGTKAYVGDISTFIRHYIVHYVHELKASENTLDLDELYDAIIEQKVLAQLREIDLTLQDLENEPLPLELKPIGDAMIQYQFYLALSALGDMPERIHSTYYAQYQLSLSIWQSLYADPQHRPNITIDRTTIHKFADPKYTQRQYRHLQKIFAPNAKRTFLERFGMQDGEVSIFNQKATNAHQPWNYLLEETHWFFAQGKDALIVKPWKNQKFVIAFIRKHFNTLWNSIRHHPQTAGLERFSAKVKNGIVLLPLLFMIPGVIAVIGFQFLLNVLPLWSILPGAVPLGAFALSLIHGIVDLGLMHLSRISKPISNAYSPFKRILLGEVDNDFSLNTRRMFKTLYPLRVLLGAFLIIFNTATLMAQKIAQSIVKNVVIGYFRLANLWFDVPAIVRGWFAKNTVAVPQNIESLPLHHDIDIEYASGVFFKYTTQKPILLENVNVNLEPRPSEITNQRFVC